MNNNNDENKKPKQVFKMTLDDKGTPRLIDAATEVPSARDVLDKFDEDATQSRANYILNRIRERQNNSDDISHSPVWQLGHDAGLRAGEHFTELKYIEILTSLRTMIDAIISSK